MNELKFKELIRKHFNNCYFCLKVWSAWSYNAMNTDDFIEFYLEDEAVNDFYNNLKAVNDLTEEKLIEVLSNYELFYNENIDDNFTAESFDSDYLFYIDTHLLLKEVKEIMV